MKILHLQIHIIKCVQNNNDRELLSFALAAVNSFNLLTAAVNKGKIQQFSVIIILNTGRIYILQLRNFFKSVKTNAFKTFHMKRGHYIFKILAIYMHFAQI